MHRIPVPSTETTKEIIQVGYQEDSETLEIQFIKGGVYQFFNVPLTVFDEFMKTPSKDTYYHTKIGERFPCSRVA
jgi:KTSC domain